MNKYRDMHIHVIAVEAILEMNAGARYLFAIFCRPDRGIQGCNEAPGFLFDVLRI